MRVGDFEERVGLSTNELGLYESVDTLCLVIWFVCKLTLGSAFVNVILVLMIKVIELTVVIVYRANNDKNVGKSSAADMLIKTDSHSFLVDFMFVS